MQALWFRFGSPHCSIHQYCGCCDPPAVPAIDIRGTLWLPVPSLILGLFSVLMLFDDSVWDMDIVMGLLLFSGTGLTLGIVGVSTQSKGKGMAIAGIVLSAIGVLSGLGLLTTV